eukprot:1157899-Pelagomonas_calceolata.AAC.4
MGCVCTCPATERPQACCTFSLTLKKREAHVFTGRNSAVSRWIASAPVQPLSGHKRAAPCLHKQRETPVSSVAFSGVTPYWPSFCGRDTDATG